MAEQAIKADAYNAQRKPEEWDGLVALAEEALCQDESEKGLRRAAGQVYVEASKIPLEQHEANRYYGLGVVVCSFARALSAPSEQEVFISSAAGRLASGHSEYLELIGKGNKGKGLFVGEIGSGLWGLVGATQHTMAAYERIPRAERFVADVLTMSPLEAGQKTSDIYSWRLDEIAKGGSAFERVRIASLAAATRVTRLALRQLFEHNEGRTLESKEQATLLVADVADSKTIANLDLVHFSAMAASLRLDELDDLESLARTDEHGAIYLNRTDIPKVPGPIKNPAVGHARRLGCPALYVAGAVPFVASAMPEIVNRAQSATTFAQQTPSSSERIEDGWYFGNRQKNEPETEVFWEEIA